MNKIITCIFCLISGIVFFSCSSSEQDPFEALVQKHKSELKQSARIDRETAANKRFINPEFTFDTFYVNVFNINSPNRKYYLAAELVHKGNSIYRKTLLLEVNTLIFIMLDNRPYGKKSWEFVASLRSWKLFKDDWYARPLNGEEYLKIISKIMANKTK